MMDDNSIKTITYNTVFYLDKSSNFIMSFGSRFKFCIKVGFNLCYYSLSVFSVVLQFTFFAFFRSIIFILNHFCSFNIGIIPPTLGSLIFIRMIILIKSILSGSTRIFAVSAKLTEHFRIRYILTTDNTIFSHMVLYY